MNVLFLTLSSKININQSGIYADLMRCFVAHGHSVYIVSPIERRYNKPTFLSDDVNVHHLHVRTLNIFNTNVIEKGIATLLLENQFCQAINQYFSNVQFNLVLYSTPPITFANVVKAVKKNNPSVVSYLLLKDIFPQNAVDLGMFSKNGIIYKYFRHKEEQLYLLSDYIGCMSPANVDYILKHNPYLEKNKVEVAPNSIEILPFEKITSSKRQKILEKYNIPINKIVFIYGGNLGKPQGIPFLIECLQANKQRLECHFVIVGKGTEFKKLLNWYESEKPTNVTILKALQKEEYDQLVQACNVGLIYLDYKFTIPNYPSRLLSYLQYKMPIIAATDPNTDIGVIAEKNGYGYACHSNNVTSFTKCVGRMMRSDIQQMGENAYLFLCNNYSTEHTYNAIVKHFQ